MWEAYGVHDRVFSMVWNVQPLSFVGLGLHLLVWVCCFAQCMQVWFLQVIEEKMRKEKGLVSIVFCKVTSISASSDRVQCFRHPITIYI